MNPYVAGGLIGWGVIGLAFFFGCMHNSGAPTRWKSKGRECGWQDIITFLLPACVIGGPIWWIAWGIVRALPQPKPGAEQSARGE